MAGSWTGGVDRAFLYVPTHTNWNDYLGATGSLMYLKDSPTFDGDVTVTGDLVVSGTGPHTIGGAVSNAYQFRVTGAYTSGGVSNHIIGFLLDPDITGITGDTVRQNVMEIAGTVTTQNNSETVALISSAYISEPVITKGTDTVTLATTLYVIGNPTEATDNFNALFEASNAQDLNVGFWCDRGDQDVDKWLLSVANADGALTFQNKTSGSYVAKLTIEPDGDVTVAGDLVVSGTGPHVIGGATVDYTRLLLLGSFTSLGGSSVTKGFDVTGALTGADGDTTYLVGTNLQNSIVTQTASETIELISQIRIFEPNITDNLTGDITLATTLYIAGAPTEGETNAALYVASGDSYLGGDLVVSGTGPHAIGGPATNAYQFRVFGAYTSGGVSDRIIGFLLDPDLTAVTEDTNRGVVFEIAGTVTTQNNSETVAVVASAYISEPVITNGTDTVTLATTLYVIGNPTEAASGENYNTVFEASNAQDLNVGFWCDRGDQDVDKWLLSVANADGALTFQNKTSGSYVAKLTIEPDGDVTVAGDLVVSGTGPHAIGGTVQGYARFRLAGNFISDGSSNVAYGLRNSAQITGYAGDITEIAGTVFQNTIVTQTAEESVGIIAQLYLDEPNITDNLTGDITLAATLYIAAAPDEGETNAALYVAAGDSILRGELRVGAAGTNDGQCHILAGATGTVGLVVEALASASVNCQQWHYNGVPRGSVHLSATQSEMGLLDGDFGNDNPGAILFAFRNTNAGSEGPAAPVLLLEMANSVTACYWTDITGKLRINTNPPTGSSGTPTVADTAGAVVGDQTSWYKLKSNINKVVDHQEALDTVLATDLYNFDMKGNHHMGLVIHEKDRGSWFSYNDDLQKQQTPCLDDRTIYGYTLASIKALHARITTLETEVEQLKAA